MPKLKTASVESELRDILADLGFDDDEFAPNDTLESLGLDSLDVAEFWLLVEDKFLGGAELDFEVVQQLDSLQKITAWLDRNRKEGK